MKVTYIFRPKGKAFSIERVFCPIMAEVNRSEDFQAEDSYAEVRKGFFSTLLANIKKYTRLSHKEGICHITCEVRYCGIFMDKKHTVLTTHDTMSLRNPKAPWYARKYAYWLQFYLPMRRLKYLTCISEATRKELISYFPWVEKKLRVITNPIDPAFSYMQKEFNADCPIILHIGTKANKNLVRVAVALKGLTCHLRIVGRLSAEQETALRENYIDYSCVSNLTDEEIIQEYENCDILSFPSLFEGFGMPIIEAQAVGRPVLTSAREPMQSVAGGASLLVNPENVAEIHEGFARLLQDSELRSTLVQKGLENIERFQPKEIARQYMALYKEMMNNA